MFSPPPSQCTGALGCAPLHFVLYVVVPPDVDYQITVPYSILPVVGGKFLCCLHFSFAQLGHTMH